MPLTRRHLLAGLGALTVTACAPGPAMEEIPTPSEPTQDPGVSTLSSAVTHLSGVTSQQTDPWRTAALAQTSAWQKRLQAADPLAGGDAIFPDSSPSPSAPPSSDLSAATQLVVDTATKAFEDAQDQPMKLFHLSVLLATRALTNLDSLPGETMGEPYRYTDVTSTVALGNALTHVWALLQALEKGLGTISSKDSRHATLLARDTELKVLRDRLIAALGTDRPRQDGNYELPAIADATTGQAAQAELELNLLNGLAGAAAATGEKEWLDEAVAQVARVQALGGQLPTWPGWVNS